MKMALVLAAALVLASGCDKKQSPSPSAAASTPAANDPGGNDGSYVLTTDASDCKVGATCTVTLRLEARGDYHLNESYPYKFTAGQAPSAEFLGSDLGGKNVFSKAAGDFAKQTEKVGVMTVKLKPSAPGNVTVEGVYKLSVCSEATCKLDNPSAKVVLAVK